MRKVILTVGLFLPLMMYSCKNTPKEQNNEEANVETAAIDSITTLAPDSIINCTLTDAQGNSLTATFNNEKGEVTIVFDGVEVVLPQQVSASGIRYSNDEFEFVQWQGETTLKQDDEVIFEHKEAAEVAEEEVTVVE